MRKVVKGQLVLLSAPSGAGKTTLVHELLRHEPDLRFSISYTTRRPRPKEVDGEDYFFVDEAEFKTMVARGEFLEHARVFDNFYGTSRSHVENLLGEGHSVLLEIDWQGARQIRAAMPFSISVFILPPSVDELQRRLRSRGSDSQAVIERRFRDAVADIMHWHEFDYAIVNEELETAVAALAEILKGAGERSRTWQPALITAARQILSESADQDT